MIVNIKTKYHLHLIKQYKTVSSILCGRQNRVSRYRAERKQKPTMKMFILTWQALPLSPTSTDPGPIGRPHTMHTVFHRHTVPTSTRDGHQPDKSDRPSGPSDISIERDILPPSTDMPNNPDRQSKASDPRPPRADIETV